jgi:hypothetical protein
MKFPLSDKDQRIKDPNHANIIEMLGRNHLITQLIEDRVNVAIPLWDQGVDLVAYYQGEGRLVARPLQLKVAELSRWGVYKKYKDIPGLLMVYVWNVKSNVQIYAMNYTEAECLLSIGPKDHAQSNSYKKDKGSYHTVPSQKLLEALKPFLMTKGRWKARLARR